jgi:hypothetical protein
MLHSYETDCVRVELLDGIGNVGLFASDFSFCIYVCLILYIVFFFFIFSFVFVTNKLFVYYSVAISSNRITRYTYQ